MEKIKILATTWHIMHYWDLCNALINDADFYLVHNSHRSWLDDRFSKIRPIPPNVFFVPYYEPNKYDLIILNCDQQLANHDLGKYKIMKELIDETRKYNDCPRIIINHGCPVYPEYLQTNDMTERQAEIECIKLIKEIIQDDTMVVNSYTAASEKEWGWGYPIWHGMNSEEWLDLPKEPRVFTALSPGGCDKYYNRECMNEVARILDEQYNYRLMWAKANKKVETFDDYRRLLGSSLIYLDTSYRTPMNRARTEAMFSGCCVIQIEGAHDLDKVYNGENMIIVKNNPSQIAKICVDLLENDYKKAIEIGKKGKETAKKLFNRERYRQDWLKLINQLIKKK
jgi:glycosyltransferase involved in cell wall biosynthesis